MTPKNEAPGDEAGGVAKDEKAGSQFGESQAPTRPPVKPGTQLARVYTAARRDAIVAVGRGADALDFAIVNRDLHSERACRSRDPIARRAHRLLALRFDDLAERLVRGGGSWQST
jgi:hypothetical protein